MSDDDPLDRKPGDTSLPHSVRWMEHPGTRWNETFDNRTSEYNIMDGLFCTYRFKYVGDKQNISASNETNFLQNRISEMIFCFSYIFCDCKYT